MNIKVGLLSVIVVILFLSIESIIACQEVSSDEKPIALMNGVAHLGNGDVIENSVITFADGKIKLVADARLVRLDLSGYQIIDFSGKHIYSIKANSNKRKRKSFDIVKDSSLRQLTENEPANLVVTSSMVGSSGNSITAVFIDGKNSSDLQFIMKDDQLKVR